MSRSLTIVVVLLAACAHEPPRLKHNQTGSTANLSDLRGRAVLLNFWADWCKPCMVEIPRMMNLAAEYGKRALFLAVYYGPEEHFSAEVNQWLSRQSSPFAKQIVWGNSSLLSQYPHHALPTTYVLGCGGETLAVFRGAIATDEREAALRQAIVKGLNSPSCNP
jgi:thiol-disulfide isomerase/thioredoxin